MFTQNIITQALKAPGVLGTGRKIAYPWDFPEVLDYWDARVGVTAAGNAVSQWVPRTGTHNLTQATGANQPTYDGSSIITFNGTSHVLQTAAFTLNQPATFLLVGKQITWSATKHIANGVSANTALYMTGSTPQIDIYAGVTAASNTDWAVNTYAVVHWVWNGASSEIGVNLSAVTTGNPGATNPGGVTLGAAYDISLPSNIAVKSFAICNSALSQSRLNQLISAMALQHGVSL